MDHFLREEGAAEKMGLKRIQFETHPQLADRLEEVCSMLDVSKREFLESAVLDAMSKAEDQFGTIYKQATGREFGEEA